jgi:tetratricopeptide (TPR) repeat protein
MKMIGRRLIVSGWICVLFIAACAVPPPAVRARRPPVASDDLMGWRALGMGRDDSAASSFQVRLAADPGDVLALFGDASLAFERGDGARALASYVALLERAATAPDDWTPLLASMAAGRVATLLGEYGGSDSGRMSIEDRLLAVGPSQLPWEARHDLALIADQIGRRRGDRVLLSRASRAAGCLHTFRVTQPAGNLPHLDLDARAPRARARSALDRTVESMGCVVSVPSFQGLGGAQRILSDIDVPGGAGVYDIVLDFAGEARVLVDDRAVLRHGDESSYGPRVSAARVALTPGRHRLELRLATFGGHPNLVVMILPASARGEQGSPTSNPEVGSPLGTAAPADDPLAPAADLAEAYVANRRGDLARTWPRAMRLGKRRGFAIGLAFAAAVARDDPSRPASIGRDAARALLQAAVGVDPHLARAWHTLAAIALDDDRARETLEHAKAAIEAAPKWWVPELALHAAYRLRNLPWDADQALDRAIVKGPGACPVIETALARAEDRRDAAAEEHFGIALAVCGRDSDKQIERMRRHGDLAGVEAALRRAIAIAPDRDGAKLNLAAVLLTTGHGKEAVDLIEASVDRGDGEGQVRLADALIMTGASAHAKATIAAAVRAHPESAELLRAARVLGLPLPVDRFRLDGRQVIRDFEASGRRYAAPAVVVLDRTVTRLFPSGAEMILTHEIVRVQSKDAIQKWGEIAVPARTEILVLRTHKADGSTREPEELAGKETISAADLTIGDYIEKETIETRPPRDAFVTYAGPGADPVGGFLGDRFYFQSFDAPLDRSEYLLVTPADLQERMVFDLRAGAPHPTRAPGPVAAYADQVVATDARAHPDHVAEAGRSEAEETVVTTFAKAQVPQLFAERSPVPAIEHVPSVRASMGVGWAAWSRFLKEQLYGTLRRAPALERAAAQIRALAQPGADPQARAAALTAWVGQNVQPENDLHDPASFSLERGRGNRLAVMLALAPLLDLDARPVFARSRLTADGDGPAPVEEADDFADPLVRFEFPDRKAIFADPRLKHAPFGYLPPGLDGARVLVLDAPRFEVARGRSDDHRAVDMAIRLDRHGDAVVEAVETLRGWPALEWAEIADRFGPDQTKLRQDFEQRWLGVHFPGAVLKELDVDISGGPAPGAGAPTIGASVGSLAAPPRRTPSAHDPRVGISGVPYTAGQVRLRYSFTSARLAQRRDGEFRLLPTFFRSQPGKRYATEPRRVTDLQIGFDVPLDLEARVELPAGAHLIEVQRKSADARGGERPGMVARRGGYSFLEERRVEGRPGEAPVLIIHREARLPLMRVPPKDYPSVADDLRRVDALEQGEIRIGFGPERR